MFCSPPTLKDVTFFHSKLMLHNCKFHSIKDEQLDTISSLILHADDATILMSDQLQADSVIQSMPLLLHWA